MFGMRFQRTHFAIMGVRGKIRANIAKRKQIENISLIIANKCKHEMNELIKTLLNKSHGVYLHYLQVHNICYVNKLTFIVMKQIDDLFQCLKGGMEQKP